MTIDWSKPICLDTVPPRQAWVVGGRVSDRGNASVRAPFDGVDFETLVIRGVDGKVSGSQRAYPRVRNLTPAELAARDGAPDDIAAELAAALRDAEGELERAREQFAFYAESHRQKQTVDGDEKAETNTRFAGYMEACRDNARAALAKWEARK